MSNSARRPSLVIPHPFATRAFVLLSAVKFDAGIVFRWAYLVRDTERQAKKKRHPRRNPSMQDYFTAYSAWPAFQQGISRPVLLLVTKGVDEEGTYRLRGLGWGFPEARGSEASELYWG